MIDAFRAAQPAEAERTPSPTRDAKRLSVSVRKRPLLPFERDAGEFDVLTCRPASARLVPSHFTAELPIVFKAAPHFAPRMLRARVDTRACTHRRSSA